MGCHSLHGKPSKTVAERDTAQDSPATVQDSFYKTLDAEAHKKAFLNEYDFDSPEVRLTHPQHSVSGSDNLIRQ